MWKNVYDVYIENNIEKEIQEWVNSLNFAQFKKIVALSNLIQRIYHNDIRNMLP